MLKVYNESCENCLFSKNRIVSAERKGQLLRQCVGEQSHFICHEATMEGKDVVCRSFYDKMGGVSQLVRIAERLDMVEFVDLPSKSV